MPAAAVGITVPAALRTVRFTEPRDRMSPVSQQEMRRTAEECFRRGDLTAALESLQGAIRREPADPKHRSFLAQLLMIQGDWSRAIDQLAVLGELDAGSLPMVHACGAAIQCERLRTDVFAGTRGPLLLGEPEVWIAELIQSVALLAQGRTAEAAELRARAFESAPAVPGTLNGTPFEWIADADSRLGPLLEVLLNGGYYWVPLHRISRITAKPPSQLSDFIWLPADFVWANGGEAVGLIPVRYPGTELAPDPATRMARRTEWRELDNATCTGLGQRVFATDSSELALLELRDLSFTPAA